MERDKVLRKMIKEELQKVLAPQTKQDPGLKKDPNSVQGKRRRSAQSDDDDGISDRARVRVLRLKRDGFAVKILPAEKKRSEEIARVRAVLLARQIARARKAGSAMQASRVIKGRAEKRKWKGRLRSSDVKEADNDDAKEKGDDDEEGNGGWKVVTRRGRSRVAAQSRTPGTGKTIGGDAGEKRDDIVQKRRESTRSKKSASSAETEEMYL